MIFFFGRSRPWLLRVWNGVLQDIWNKFGARIQLNKPMMTLERIKQYTTAIGSSLGDDLIFDFIDGTEVHVCCPGEENQELFYSGHYKQYTCGHLAIVLPDGLFGTIFTGLPAAGGDATLCI